MTSQGSQPDDDSAKRRLHDRVDNDFGYHRATVTTGPMHDDVRRHFKSLAHWVVDNTPAGREQSLALTTLQEAQMWTNAAVAINLSPLETA